MMAAHTLNTVLLLCLSFICYVLYRGREKRRRHDLPPGPEGWPLIGNAFDIPDQDGWLKYASMGKKYGDMIYMEAFGQPLIILNSFERVIDLFEKRSSNYSSRPVSTYINVLSNWGWQLAFIPYGDVWRRRRRLLHNYLHRNNMDSHHPVQIQATRALVKDLQEDPAHFFEHAAKHAGTIILKLTYDYDVQQKDDPLVHLADEGNSRLMLATQGGLHLVDVFPILQYVPSWFPGAKFRRIAAEAHAFSSKMLNEPFDVVKSKMASNAAPSCMASHYLSQLETDPNPAPDQEGVIKEAAGVSYAAGADTTSSSIMTFILAMVLYSEVQKKAQAELDLYVGSDRLPTFDDKTDLPYIHCIVEETMRWQPVVRLSVAHKSISDDVYDGFFIPAGTVITPNSWAMLYNEDMYPEPEKFNPDRFLPEEGKAKPLDPSDVAFGFGRRICPGRYLAYDTVWIATASILSAFNIVKALDDKGSEITPEISYSSGLVSYPKPFKCRFIPRSEKLRKLLESDT